jgi:small GTP-binding protein
MNMKMNYSGRIEELENYWNDDNKFFENNLWLASIFNYHWNAIEEDTYVLFIGKTGYGKSTTINKLIGKELFNTSDVESCTRECEAAKFLFANQKGSLHLIDLPGIGETMDLDIDYLNLYSSLIENSTLVTYILRADQRDFSIDLKAFQTLFLDEEDKNKVIIGLNYVDKIEPINRSFPLILSEAQKKNLEMKLDDISSTFSINKENIIPFSASGEWQLNQLYKKIKQKISQASSPTHNMLKRREYLARSGNIDEQISLGKLYLEGTQVKKDLKKAFGWIKMASENRSAEAQYLLGQLYENGIGVQQNISQSYYWYKMSAEKGKLESQIIIATFHYEGTKIRKDDRLAFKWFREAALQGNAFSQNKLGILCEKGLGVQQDYYHAFHWYKKAADLEDANAQFNLGRLFEDGRGTLQSNIAALTWYKRAAENGHKEASNKVKLLHLRK